MTNDALPARPPLTADRAKRVDGDHPLEDATGPVLFARYAYPPNELGYCGPGDSSALLEGAAAADQSGELTHLATHFDGAWPYLALIARCNGIDDPLDRRVVEAYWTGNELLWRVPASALFVSLRERFEARAGTQFSAMLAAASVSVAQHNFHVFAVYPWLGLLRAGMDGAPLEVLDRCRIRWGQVDTVAGDFAWVRSRALGFDGHHLTLGNERLERVRHRLDGVGPVPRLAPGDAVALHWDWISDRLTPQALHWLVACTRRNLAAVNALPRPGPAVACDV